MNGSVQARFYLGSMELSVQGIEQDVVNKRGFARSGNAANAGEASQGNARVNPLQVMVAGVGNFQPFAASRAPLVWDGDLLAASQVMAGNGLRTFFYLFGGATGD